MALGIQQQTGELMEVPGDLFGIAQEVVERWPNLRIQFLNPERAEIGDAPYIVVEYTKWGPQKVMDVWELDHRVIDRLHQIDSSKIDVLAAIEKHNAKLKEEQDKKEQEVLSERLDVLTSSLKHFGKGKQEFHYTTEDGQKRVVTEQGARDKETKVL